MQDSAIFDKIAFQYDENRGGEDRGKRFANSLIPLLTPGRRVLEIGVGTGVVASAIEAAGFDIIGIDSSKEMLKYSVPRLRNAVWSDMNNSLPFLDEYFGSAYCVWALHLAKDIPAMLREARRVLQPGGCFMNCSTMNKDVGPTGDAADRIVWDLQAALAGPRTVVDSPDQLRLLAADAGFEFETAAGVSHEYVTTPAKLALHLQRRGMSVLQLATAEQERDLIAPAIKALLALPDEELQRSRVHQISVLRAI